MLEIVGLEDLLVLGRKVVAEEGIRAIRQFVEKTFLRGLERNRYVNCKLGNFLLGILAFIAVTSEALTARARTCSKYRLLFLMEVALEQSKLVMLVLFEVRKQFMPCPRSSTRHFQYLPLMEFSELRLLVLVTKIPANLQKQELLASQAEQSIPS